jgi:hypothetical protein
MSKEDESESTNAGHFPPNSKVTGVRCSTAAVITIFPTRALPKILIYKFKKYYYINGSFLLQSRLTR